MRDGTELRRYYDSANLSAEDIYSDFAELSKEPLYQYREQLI